MEGKKRWQVISLFVLLVLLGIGAGRNAGNMQEAEQEEEADQNTDTFEGIYRYLLDTDSYKYDEEIIKVWETKEKQAVLNEYEKEREGRGIYVQACLLQHDGKWEEAGVKYRAALKKAKDLKMKARCYFELSRNDAKKEAYEQAENELKKMEKLLEKDDPDLLIRLNIECYSDILEWPDGVNKAVKWMEKTRDLAEKCGYEKKEEVLSELAVCYYYAGEDLKGMETKVEGLSLAQEHKNTEMVVQISADIGIDYLGAQNYEKAIEYLEKSRDTILQQKWESDEYLIEFRVYVANNLINCYLEKGQNKKAKAYLKEAKEMVSREQDGKQKTDDLTYTMYTEVQYLLENKEYEKALSTMKQVQKRYEESKYFLYMNFDIGCVELYGRIYNAMGEYEKALDYWRKVAKMYKDQGIDISDNVYASGFYESYVGMKDYKRALKYKNQMYDEIEKMYEGKEKEQANFLLEKFESKKRDEEINHLQTRNHILRMVIIFAILFFIVILLFFMIIFRKSREIRRLNEKFRELSEKDGLTGLYNRRAMDEYLEQNWDRLLEQFSDVCTLMFDVDFFKKYNDFYGHQGGDEVLRKVSHVIAEKSPEGAMAVRYGGEEFVMILPGATLTDAQQVADRIREGVRKLAIRHEKSEVSKYVSISIGVAEAEEGLGSDEVLKRADDALYEAKKKRDTVYVFARSTEEKE